MEPSKMPNWRIHFLKENWRGLPNRPGVVSRYDLREGSRSSKSRTNTVQSPGDGWKAAVSQAHSPLPATTYAHGFPVAMREVKSVHGRSLRTNSWGQQRRMRRGGSTMASMSPAGQGLSETSRDHSGKRRPR